MLSSSSLVRAWDTVLARVVALGFCTGPWWRVVAGNISAEVTAGHDRADPCRMLAVGCWQVPSELVALESLHCPVEGSKGARDAAPTAVSKWPAQLRVQPG
jgi:hypothetical protein